MSSKQEIFTFATDLLCFSCAHVTGWGTAYEGQMMWINHWSFSGGHSAYYGSMTNTWFSGISTVGVILQVFMNDSLLVRTSLNYFQSVKHDITVS